MSYKSTSAILLPGQPKVTRHFRHHVPQAQTTQLEFVGRMFSFHQIRT